MTSLQRFDESKGKAYHASSSRTNPVQDSDVALQIEEYHNIGPQVRQQQLLPGADKSPYVVGVAGGTASGKTSVCKMIIHQLRDRHVVIIGQDSFYRDLTAEESLNVGEYDFDHPDAFDVEQLLECLQRLKQRNPVSIPMYDFETNKIWSEEFRKENPVDFIIVKGILVFHDPRVRELMDLKIFVDTDADIQLAQRIQRDTRERGRDVQAVIEQYLRFVKPAFDEFVLPSKKYADIVLPQGADNYVAIDLIVELSRTKLGLVLQERSRIFPNVSVIQSTYQIRGIHTLLRDQRTTRDDFVFYADRLIRLVVEHGLGHLPFTEKRVDTHTSAVYVGVEFSKQLCAVSIIGGGESMENAVRACCKAINIGKILIHRRSPDTGRKPLWQKLPKDIADRHVVLQRLWQKLPKDIAERHVLLLDPVLATGDSAIQAIELLKEKGVPEQRIIFLNLISAPEGIRAVLKRFPFVKIVTSEIDLGLSEDLRVVPGIGSFADRYFGSLDE